MRGYTFSHLRSTSVSLRFLVSFAHSDLWLVLLTAVFAGYGVRANVARRASLRAAVTTRVRQSYLRPPPTAARYPGARSANFYFDVIIPNERSVPYIHTLRYADTLRIYV